MVVDEDIVGMAGVDREDGHTRSGLEERLRRHSEGCCMYRLCRRLRLERYVSDGPLEASVARRARFVLVVVVWRRSWAVDNTRRCSVAAGFWTGEERTVCSRVRW